MASPLAVPILAILVRSEHSNVSSSLLKFATFYLISSVTISSGSRATHQRGDHEQIANELRKIRSATEQLAPNTVKTTAGLSPDRGGERG